jgi:26S proteasome regulatory subunit N12
MRLIVQNRIAEFHTQLELISPEDQRHPSIDYAVQVEQWLMEGAYNKVLEAGKTQPSEAHKPLLDKISLTVREEIASCCEKAYARLKLSDAQHLMMFESQSAVKSYADKQGWQVGPDGYISFNLKDANESKENKEAASMGLISNTLVYAKELERIV